MSIPSSFARSPSLFQDQSSKASGLGRWSISFAFDWNTLPIINGPNVPFPLWPGANAGVFDFNALSFQTAFQNLGSIRSITFSSSDIFSALTPQFPGELAFYSADSGMAHRVGPNFAAFAAVDPPNQFGFILNGCLPLNMGSTTPLTIIKAVTSTGTLQGRFWGTVTNYELPSYLYTGGTYVELA